LFNNSCVDNNPADATSGGGSCYHLVGSTGPATINCQNNVATNTYNLIEISAAVSSITIDYNVYANAGPAAFSYTKTWPPSFFSVWQSAIKGDTHSTYNSSAALSSTGVPSPNSPIRSAGKNLTPLCATLPALCFTTTAGNTIKPAPRPTTGPWDAGAYLAQ
jgi:hypothetical protein